MLGGILLPEKGGIKCYGYPQMTLLGQAIFPVSYKGITENIKFKIVKHIGETDAMLGTKGMKMLELFEKFRSQKKRHNQSYMKENVFGATKNKEGCIEEESNNKKTTEKDEERTRTYKELNMEANKLIILMQQRKKE